LDNNQDDHRASVVELEGMIANQLVSILIDQGSNLSYVAPQNADKCKLQPIRHVKPWPVQLSNGTKIKVEKVIRAYQLIMGGMPTQANLNILPLGCYDLLIAMDWLHAYKTKLDCYYKTL
jgi:hypothetical protein